MFRSPCSQVASLRALAFGIGVSVGKGGDEVSPARVLQHQQHQTEQNCHFSRLATHILQSKQLTRRKEKGLVWSHTVTGAILGKSFRYLGPYSCPCMRKPVWLSFPQSSPIPASAIVKGITATYVTLGVNRCVTMDASVWPSGQPQESYWFSV